MRTVTVLKSDIDNSDYDTVLTAIDISASDLEPGAEEEIKVIVKNDITDDEETDDEATETEKQSEE